MSCRILKWHFDSFEEENPALNESRGFACEIVAWRFLAPLSEHDLIEYLLHDLSASHQEPERSLDEEASSGNVASTSTSRALQIDEHSPLVCERRFSRVQLSTQEQSRPLADESLALAGNDLGAAFVGLNALEVAAVAKAKKFLSQQVVQKVVNNIWSGDIVFWDALNIHTKKKAQLYNHRYGALNNVQILSTFLLLLAISAF